MSKQILILNGSPRKHGNTAALIDAFTQGAEQAGHQVTTFLLDTMSIHGCKGCFGGGKDPLHPCVQRDDMEAIYPVYRKADLVVLASPLYYWNFTGQLLTAFHRLFAVAECNPGYANPKKEAVLLMAAEGYDFGDCLRFYDHLLQHLGWIDRGKILAGGNMEVNDIAGKGELDQARRLGAGLA